MLALSDLFLVLEMISFFIYVYLLLSLYDRQCSFFILSLLLSSILVLPLPLNQIHDINAQTSLLLQQKNLWFVVIWLALNQ